MLHEHQDHHGGEYHGDEHSQAEPDWSKHGEDIELDGDTFGTCITDTAERMVALRSAAAAS